MDTRVDFQHGVGAKITRKEAKKINEPKLSDLTKDELLKLTEQNGFIGGQESINWIRYQTLRDKEKCFFEESNRMFDLALDCHTSGNIDGYQKNMKQHDELVKKEEGARKKADVFYNTFLMPDRGENHG